MPLVGTPRNGDRAAAHLGGELHTEMTETANAKHSGSIPRTNPAVAQCIVGGDSSAEERRSLGGACRSFGIAAKASNGAIM